MSIRLTPFVLRAVRRLQRRTAHKKSPSPAQWCADDGLFGYPASLAKPRSIPVAAGFARERNARVVRPQTRNLLKRVLFVRQETTPLQGCSTAYLTRPHF